MSDDDLLPCPFCGSKAHIEQHGTRRQSCIVECNSCGLRHESGDEGNRCGTSWNRRAAPVAPAAAAPTYKGYGESEALVSLECTAQWLDNGCDPKAAAGEIRSVMNMLHATPVSAGAAAPTVDDLAMLVRQLVHALRTATQGNGLADRAMEYLKRKGLDGSPLRVETQPGSPHFDGAEAYEAYFGAVAQPDHVAHDRKLVDQTDERAAWLEELNALVLEYGNAVEGSASRIRHIKRIMDHARATAPQATVKGDERAASFEAWFADYHKEACEQFGGIDCTNPKGIAEDAWNAARAAAAKAAPMPPMPYHWRDTAPLETGESS